MKVEKLNWDSEFFNLNVGKVELTGISLKDITDLYKYDLVYFFINPNDFSINKQLVEAQALLVDEKVTYCKKVSEISSTDINISSYTRKLMHSDEDVVRIGLQSGIFSRFNLDPGFTKNDFERLYTTWMNRSIDREVADEVFVYQENDKIIGTVTVREVNNKGDIGIFAVDAMTRGKKIGTKLLNHVNAYCIEKCYEGLQVITQKANADACKFYEKNGFTIDSVINVYHLWI